MDELDHREMQCILQPELKCESNRTINTNSLTARRACVPRTENEKAVENAFLLLVGMNVSQDAGAGLSTRTTTQSTTTTLVPGAQAAQDRTCAAGHYWNTEQLRCWECSAGSYAADAGLRVGNDLYRCPKACDDGYTSKTGATSQKQCELGIKVMWHRSARVQYPALVSDCFGAAIRDVCVWPFLCVPLQHLLVCNGVVGPLCL